MMSNINTKRKNTSKIYIGFICVLVFLSQGCVNSINNENTEVKNEVQNETPEISSKIAPTPKQIQLPHTLVPEGYSIYETISGDLNKDGIKDSVFIVKRINKENIVVDEYRGDLDRNRRGILIFLNKNEEWVLESKNMNCFSSENEDGGVYYPPQLSMDVKKGNLYLHYEHGRYGFWKYTFRHKDSNFELIGYDASENYGPIINNEISVNFLSKKKLERRNTNEDTEESGDEVFEEKWEDIHFEKLINLSEIEDFDLLRIP